MPAMKCQSKKKLGVKYGSGGKCYTGPGKEEKMKKQAAAIEASKAKKKG